MTDFRNRIVGYGTKKASQFERWKPIPGYEGVYSVSDFGRVRREKISNGSKPGRILRDVAHNSGYRSVALWNENKGKMYLIHRLIMFAFIGQPKPGYEVNHKDVVKIHNWLDNLEYVTPSQNRKHAVDYGLFNVVGSNNPQAKINESTAVAIRVAYSTGLGGYKAIAKAFGISWGIVRSVVKRKTWRNV